MLVPYQLNANSPYAPQSDDSYLSGHLYLLLSAKKRFPGVCLHLRRYDMLCLLQQKKLGIDFPINVYYYDPIDLNLFDSLRENIWNA